MSQHAVLNANYLRHRIFEEAEKAGVRHQFVDGAPVDVVKHEFTLSMAPMKEQCGIGAMDIAKGLLDKDTWLQRFTSPHRSRMYDG